MKTISEMTNTETMVNGIYNSGTDLYVLSTNEYELDKEFSICDQWQEGCELFDNINHNAYLDSLPDFGFAGIFKENTERRPV